MQLDPSGLSAKPECADSLKELYGFLDGELTIERRHHIQAHLDGCPPCFEAYDFEAELRQVVAARCKDEVPPHLRSRVAAALQAMLDDQDAQPPSS